jgi:hypothetical protein
MLDLLRHDDSLAGREIDRPLSFPLAEIDEEPPLDDGEVGTRRRERGDVDSMEAAVRERTAGLRPGDFV